MKLYVGLLEGKGWVEFLGHGRGQGALSQSGPAGRQPGSAFVCVCVCVCVFVNIIIMTKPKKSCTLDQPF